jgi:hypothetical protein
MAAPSKKIYSVGLNAARYYALSTAGYPAATNATVYSGVPIGGPTAFALTIPESETVAHPGNNSIQQYDVLPSNGVSSGSLTISRQDADAIALFTGTKVNVLNSFANQIGWNTSQQGLEPTVALVTYDQAKSEAGDRVWHTYVMPRVVILPKPKSMQRERQDLTYTVQPQVCTKSLTGRALTANDDGFTTAQILDYSSSHRIAFSAWVTTATEADYIFDVALPKAVTGDVGQVVYKNGVLMTYGATADVTHYIATTLKITFGGALTNGDVVTIMYEIADTAIDIG